MSTTTFPDRDARYSAFGRLRAAIRSQLSRYGRPHHVNDPVVAQVVRAALLEASHQQSREQILFALIEREMWNVIRDDMHYVENRELRNIPHKPLPTFEEIGAQLKRNIDNYRNAVRLEITEELLSGYFALGDGRRVTWGDATLDDHAQRVNQLMSHAQGTVETAVRHQAAIEMIRDAGVHTLREVVHTKEEVA
jgi:hypothetical protein